MVKYMHALEVKWRETVWNVFIPNTITLWSGAEDFAFLYPRDLKEIGSWDQLWWQLANERVTVASWFQ